MKKITKTDIVRLVMCIFIWVAINFVGDYFFVYKGSYRFDLWDSILVPGISATIVWVLIEWKPWKKTIKNEETECDNAE